VFSANAAIFAAVALGGVLAFATRDQWMRLPDAGRQHPKLARALPVVEQAPTKEGWEERREEGRELAGEYRVVVWVKKVGRFFDLSLRSGQLLILFGTTPVCEYGLCASE
jgi:hypothetical protein